MTAPAALKLGYSLCWDDPAIDLEALAIRPGDRVVTIASAGCNALSLLLSGAERVTAVDYNPYQNALLELKAAAVASLGREEYLQFAGETDGSPDRTALFAGRVEPALHSREAREFWAARPEWIAAGVHRAGALERHFGLWRKLMRLIQGRRRIDAMFGCDGLEEQRRFFEDQWNRLPYRAVVRLFFNRTALGWAKHPDHFRYVTEPDIAGNFLEKCRHALTDLHIRDNYFLAQIFLGRYLDAKAVPPFLREENYPAVKERLERLTIVTADMRSALDQLPAGSVRAFYLSNICEWLADSQVDEIFEAMTRAAATGARATLRTLLAERATPERFRDRWRQLEPLSTELRFRDRSFLYSTYRVLELQT
ncbi:MAG: DUF3419 family protein [Candidatus Wallbacteria bacterium]|nr:DUF3419 family protein [Candidatus Wallbacteria bacterium]